MTGFPFSVFGKRLKAGGWKSVVGSRKSVVGNPKPKAVTEWSDVERADNIFPTTDHGLSVNGKP